MRVASDNYSIKLEGISFFQYWTLIQLGASIKESFERYTGKAVLFYDTCEKWTKILGERYRAEYPSSDMTEYVGRVIKFNLRYFEDLFDTGTVTLNRTTSMHAVLEALHAFRKDLILKGDIYKTVSVQLEELKTALSEVKNSKPQQNEPYLGTHFLPQFSDNYMAVQDFRETLSDSYKIYYRETFLSNSIRARKPFPSPSYHVIFDTKKPHYFVPPILYHTDFYNEWIQDMSSVSQYPQGIMWQVCETGDIATLSEHAKPSLCLLEFYEPMTVTKRTIQRLYKDGGLSAGASRMLAERFFAKDKMEPYCNDCPLHTEQCSSMALNRDI